jgi:hypothetical protein
LIIDFSTLAISRTAAAYGFVVGKTRQTDSKVIGAIAKLELLYRRLGEVGLNKTLALATTWSGQAASTDGFWLEALGLLVRDGYVDRFSAEHYERLREVIPALELQKARGRLVQRGYIHSVNGGGQSFTAVAYEIAGALRRRMRMRILPVQATHHDDHRSRPLV